MPIIGLTAPVVIDPAYRAQRHEEGVWIDRQGREIPIGDMSDDHLRAVAGLLWSVARREVRKTQAFYLCTEGPRGEYAQLAFEEEFMFWIDGDDDDLAIGFLEHEVPIWPYVAAECRRRGIRLS